MPSSSLIRVDVGIPRGMHRFKRPLKEQMNMILLNVAAKLEWCTGDIGLSGVSYLVQSQWMVAQMRPPSLKAIVAWEGWCDGTTTKPTAKASLKYDSESDDRLKFNFKFNKETAMVGYSKLRLAIQTPDNDDAEIFVALRKLDDEGEQVTFTYFTVYEHGPIAQGCLRASHRALDEKRSKDYQPWRNHDKLEPLDPKKVYEINIELLAATARFLPGESLQIVIGGTDITKCKPSLAQKHGDRKNKGQHIVWTGGEWDAHLLLPTVEGLDLGTVWGNR
jgi:predicted acyl esterase